MKHLYILIALLISTSAMGQTKRAFIKAAEKAVAENNTYAALTYFNEALEFDEDNPELLYKAGVQAYKMRAYELAKQRFSVLVDSLGNKTFSDADFYYGASLLALGENDASKERFDAYKKNDNLGINPEFNIAKVLWLIDNGDKLDKSAIVENMGELNTTYSEFGPMVYDDVLYYTSMQHQEEVPKGEVPRSISKIHAYDGDSTIVVDKEINASNKSVAYLATTDINDRWFYTECDYINADSIRCDLYYRILNEDGSQNDKVLIPGSINSENYTSTTPFLATYSGQKRLYFASDRPGGKGGLDIWYSAINELGQFSEPVNMESINTSQDELAPFVHEKTNTLYFSSNGYPGYGGFDIYKMSEDGQEHAEALLAPVNSSYDDVYYYIDENEETGYFSSNRGTSAYVDAVLKACCFDIYKVTYDDVIIDMDIQTFDALTKDELDGAVVYMIDKNSGDTLAVVEGEETFHHTFQLHRNKDYIFVAKRPHYEDYTWEFSTHDITESVELTEPFYMKPTSTQVDIYTFNKRTKEALPGTDIIVTNRKDPSYRMTYNTGSDNHEHIYLELGGDYVIECSKLGFVTERISIDLSNSSEPEVLRRDVYLDVFEIEDYKNTAVYFENDYPNPKSRSDKTDMVYGEHYTDYITHRSEYLKKMRKNKKVLDKTKGEMEVNAYFDQDVVVGYETFQKFMKQLRNELEKGRRLEVVLKGYASPVADSKYNAALSTRRVNAVKNEMLRFENGLFRHYLGKGLLKITDISYGDSRAPSDVSDDPRDTYSSVYSIMAARERRVEIIRVSEL